MNKMRQLGISIYPTNQKIDEMKKYILYASKLGYTRIFSSLLMVTKKDKEKLINKYKNIFQYAKKLKFDICLDVSPEIFDILEINYNDLSFFNKIHVSTIRLDTPIDGITEANMTYNQYGINIEINMSNGFNYLLNILSFMPLKDRLIACHNFYPQVSTGLEYEFFIKSSKATKKCGIRTAAFISSNYGKSGPWNAEEGLPTLEMHRNLEISTQAKHLWATGLIDDVLIGNAFATNKELKKLANVNRYKIGLVVNILEKSSKVERDIIKLKTHFRRGDINEFIVRSTMSRVWYKNSNFDIHDSNHIQSKGDIFICNNNFKNYKGELQLILKELTNDKRKNLVARVIPSELFLINHINSWTKFEFIINDN